ncbi:MAG TPA: PIN domain-containing protein [Stellaceae bacterium]|nr:PIN domain-containing protein [Stellaceae bacterium]
MIYLDSSVLLASVFREERVPPEALWDERLASSRLLAYEVWSRLNAYRLASSHGDRARARLDRVDLIELSESALSRALEPFPVALRTLDALHLATIDFVRRRSGEPVALASYDNRLLAAAQALGIPLAAL